MTQNIHATTVEIKGAGVIITGESGTGKSDLALRLIENKNAVLVSDDQTLIESKDGQIIASSPQSIEGLLEVRNIGILRLPFKKTTLCLAIELTKKPIERLPEPSFLNLNNILIPKIQLHAFEASTPDKIVVKLNTLLAEKTKKSRINGK